MTLWAALLGGASINLIQMVTDQISVQRYLTAPSLKDSQRALWFKLWVTLPLLMFFCLTGTTLFSYYHTFPERQPDPKAPLDQLLPFFVVHQLPSPLPGLLIAAVFGATMAVASAGINSLATTVLMDFWKTKQQAGNQGRQVLLARGLTIFFGVLITLLALGLGQVDKTLVDSIFIIQGLFGGPLLGIFFLGVLLSRANGSGALVGAVGGGMAALLVAFSEQLFSYKIDSLWISFSAAGVTFVVGGLASLLFAAPDTAAKTLVYRLQKTNAVTSRSNDDWDLPCTS
jgi:sodium-coupled monocarboxylate transporter 8/12